jgi:hypothetical protein
MTSAQLQMAGAVPCGAGGMYFSWLRLTRWLLTRVSAGAKSFVLLDELTAAPLEHSHRLQN